MAVKYKKFVLATKIKKDESARLPNHARFIAEAFEKGFGHTVGNMLRRILLIGMEAPAVMSIRFEDVPHEYTAIEGVIEDVTHIVLNFKEVLLRKLPTEEEHVSREPRIISKVVDITSQMLDKNGGQYAVTVRDVLGDAEFDLVNPDHVLFTVTKPFTKRIEVKVGFGRGYVPSDRYALTEKNVDEIILDAAFSPVRLVNYYVENTRVGQDTDFDRLILDVTTDGRITPEEALSFATQIGIVHLEVFGKPHLITFDAEEIETNTDKDALLAKLALKINEIELSVRSTNCLSQANIATIGELVVMSEPDMLKFRNFGKKSLKEIEDKLSEMGLSLGMDLTRYGIRKDDNIKQIIADYIARKGAEPQE